MNGYGGDSGVFCCQDGMSIYGVDVGLVPEQFKFLFDLGFRVSQNVLVDPTILKVSTGVLLHVVSGFPHNVFLGEVFKVSTQYMTLAIQYHMRLN